MSDEQNLNLQPQGDETVNAAEGADAEVVKPDSGVEPAGELAEDADLTPEDADAEAEGDEPSAEADEAEAAAMNEFLEQQADKLAAADPERFQTLQDRFVADEPFSAEDITWISQTVGLDEATVAYGISLQRVVFKAEQSNVKPEVSVSDAEAEVGSLDALIAFAQANAPADKLAEWQTVAQFAGRTGDDKMTLGLLKELKAFKDSIPGQKPKTLGHLAGASNSPKTETAEPVKPAAAEPAVDELLNQLQSYSDMALAQIVQNTQADAAARGRAAHVLRQRGILS